LKIRVSNFPDDQRISSMQATRIKYPGVNMFFVQPAPLQPAPVQAEPGQLASKEHMQDKSQTFINTPSNLYQSSPYFQQLLAYSNQNISPQLVAHFEKQQPYHFKSERGYAQNTHGLPVTNSLTYSQQSESNLHHPESDSQTPLTEYTQRPPSQFEEQPEQFQYQSSISQRQPIPEEFPEDQSSYSNSNQFFPQMTNLYPVNFQQDARKQPSPDYFQSSPTDPLQVTNEHFYPPIVSQASVLPQYPHALPNWSPTLLSQSNILPSLTSNFPEEKSSRMVKSDSVPYGPPLPDSYFFPILSDSVLNGSPRNE
jgi:hypothetical protein